MIFGQMGNKVSHIRDKNPTKSTFLNWKAVSYTHLRAHETEA